MDSKFSLIITLLISITAHSDENFYTFNFNKSTFLNFNSNDFCRGKGEYLDKSSPFSFRAMQTKKSPCLNFEEYSDKWIVDKRGNYYLLNNIRTQDTLCLKNLPELVHVRCINNQTGNISLQKIGDENLKFYTYPAPISIKNSNLVFFLLYLISSLLLVFGILIPFKKRWIEQILFKIIYKIKKWGL
jgi:hypothetical protein